MEELSLNIALTSALLAFVSFLVACSFFDELPDSVRVKLAISFWFSIVVLFISTLFYIWV